MGKLNKSQGNMYSWVTHTWSPISGCPHQCSYCYVRKYRELAKRVTLDETFPALGKGRVIFVAHMGDLFAEGVSGETIGKVVEHCKKYPENRYVFQTKNPRRLWAFQHIIPRNSIVGTTIETDDAKLLEQVSGAPPPMERFKYIRFIGALGFETFITVEPIMDFYTVEFPKAIVEAEPGFVNIGADSKGHGLKEPSAGQVESLKQALHDAGIEIRKKSNLVRLR